MNINIKTWLTTAAVGISLILAGPVKAQQKQQMAGQIKNSTPEQRAQLQTGMMKTRLKLDSAQTLKVQSINLKYAQKADPIIKGDENKLSKYRQMKAIDEQKDKDLKQIFTTDQYKQYQDIKAEIREKIQEYMKSRGQANG